MSGLDERETEQWDAAVESAERKSDELSNELKRLLSNGSAPSLERVFALLACAMMENTIEQRHANRLATASIEQTAVLIQFLIDAEPGGDDEPTTYLDNRPRKSS